MSYTTPLTWAYLNRQSEAFNKRRNSIYNNQPPFSVFGIGDYTFAPWKVAIAVLYKRLSFYLIAPFEEKPVILDDTVYFIPFDKEEDARLALEALNSNIAVEYFNARIFWDNKRPVNKRILQSLDLQILQAELGLIDAPDPPRQTSLFA